MKTMINSIIVSAVMIGSTGYSLENKIPEGYNLKDRISFEYDKEECGEIDFFLDDNDDCTVEFRDFFAASDFEPYRECHLKIIVDLPKGLKMGPSFLNVEGDYQIGKKGEAYVEASYGIEYHDPVWIKETFHGDPHERVISEAFVLHDRVPGQYESECGGKAVFEGIFKIGAEKGHDAETEIAIDKKERENIAIWGWDYEKCNTKPKYCSGIAGDPELKDLYPECHDY